METSRTSRALYVQGRAVKGTVRAESCGPPAGLLLPPPPPPLPPPSRGETGSPPESDAPLGGTTDTSESETGILERKGDITVTSEPDDESSHLKRTDFTGAGLWAEPVHTFRDPSGENGRGPDNLRITLEGDVAADHVEEQNPQRPDGERDGLVGLRQDPLRRTVDPST